MKNNIMSFTEIDTLNRNINMIESRLGYEIPKYMMDADDLSKDILSLSEVDTYARNIEMMNLRRGIRTPRKRANRIAEIYENVFFGGLFLFLAGLFLYAFITGI